jgi:hypothetical protein
MKDAPPDWQPLRDIFYSGLLDIDLAFDNRESAVANAVRSGDVAVRGQLASELGLGFSAFDRIEKRLSSDWDISVWENQAQGRESGGRYVRYWDAQADLCDVQKWIRENALPQWCREARAFEPPEHPQAKRRPRPKRDRAQRLLLKMFPPGLPSKDELPDQELIAMCKGIDWKDISPDTLARAIAELREAKKSDPSRG